MPENQGQEKRRRRIPSPFTAVRMVRLGISAVRTVGAIGAFFANPASLVVLVPVGLFVLALFVILFGSGFKGAPGVPEITGGGEEKVGIRLDYTIPFRNTSLIVADTIKAQQAIMNEFPAAQLQYWETIVSRSKDNGWNPAFVLALWIEETGASHHTKIGSGGGNVSPLANGHLGCAPKENQTIDESLNCLFKNFSTYTDFEAFMAKYSGGPPTDPFSNNPDFPARIKRYYTLLFPEGITSIPSVASDCPVPGGEVTTPSYEVGQKSGKKNGHCDIYSYEFVCSESCSTTGRRAKSIDVPTNGKDVILPTVQGKSVNWIFMQPYCAGGGTYPKCYDFKGGTGALYTFKGTSPELTDTWYIQFVHMDIEQTYLNPDDHTTTYLSGTPIGKTDKTGHVHTTIGKNINDPYGPCDSGWQATDFICR